MTVVGVVWEEASPGGIPPGLDKPAIIPSQHPMNPPLLYFGVIVTNYSPSAEGNISERIPNAPS